MRDYFLFVVLGLALLFAVARPLWGLAIWSWLGYMSPHRLAYGFIRDLPVVWPAVGVTVIALLFNWKDRMRWRWTPVTLAWALLVAWFLGMSLFALYPELAAAEISRTWKIQLMVLITYFIVRDRRGIDLMVWVIVMSIGFYGFKGGLFTLATGGRFMVWGPPGTFLEGNNEIALALTMMLPLLWYLSRQATNQWLKRALMLGFVLCLVSVVGSYSRGAYLAIAAVLGAIWWRSNRKVLGGLLVVVAALAAFGLMPEKFTTRVDSIANYAEDVSAQGRINAWGFAWNLALEHPIKGGGYGVFNREAFLRYAPDGERYHDSHSIYFEILGEQGFVGLALFLGFGALAFLESQRIRKATRDDPEKAWAFDLATALQASAIAYAVGGAFLGLAYLDLPYQLVALLVLTGRVALPDAKEIELSKPPLTAAERRRLRSA
jgi:probable O-glycosylation ligase (exosortase A-associated)